MTKFQTSNTKPQTIFLYAKLAMSRLQPKKPNNLFVRFEILEIAMLLEFGIGIFLHKEHRFNL